MNIKGPFIPSVSVNAAMTFAILFSLKTMESLQNGFATHFQVSPLISMRKESLASSQSGRSVDADAWCKRALNEIIYEPMWKRCRIPLRININEAYYGTCSGRRWARPCRCGSVGPASRNRGSRRSHPEPRGPATPGTASAVCVAPPARPVTHGECQRE